MKFSLPFADKLPPIPQRAMPAIGAPVMVLATLAMVVLPIPAFLLDLFFTFNIALAMVTTEFAELGTQVEITMPSGKQMATVVERPFYDPKKQITTA